MTRRWYNSWGFEVAFAVALTAVALALCATNVAADEALQVQNAWARPSMSGSDMSAAYLTIANPNGTDDVLLEARSDVAKAVELHENAGEAGVMRMRRVSDGLTVPAHGMLAFTPGGYHMMLIGLKQKLDAGAHVPLTLVFKNAGELHVEAVVQMAAPATAGEGHHHH